MRGLLKLAFRLWPLWLFWFLRDVGFALWRDDVLLPVVDKTTASYRTLYQLWPTVTLAGPILAMLAACGLHRARRASRTMALASMAGVALALFVTLRPEWQALAPCLGHASPLAIFEAATGHLYALAAGLFALAIGFCLLWGDRSDVARAPGCTVRDPTITVTPTGSRPRRRKSCFPVPIPLMAASSSARPIASIRIVSPGAASILATARRGDQRNRARAAPPSRFDPRDRATWGRGGSTPLLIDPCRDGSTHALVIAGSGGFKTSATGVPTMLSWTGSAVVLDPAREIGPMVAAARTRGLGQRVVTLDPSDPAGGGFDVLDWIDTTAPLAETNVEAVATWLAGEPARGQNANSGAEFFRDMGRQLIACLLADLLWDAAAGERTLRALRQRLVTPEQEMRTLLADIHARSASLLARDYAGTLKGLVEETFSGVYANAAQTTRWLSTKAYADLVSGDSFRTRDLADGGLTVFVQIPLKTLEATPGLGRVMIGSLLNAAYEADGDVRGRILFLLDEVARLGPMRVLETARDAGRKYGLTLLLLYQSVGQFVEQWGKDGARAWYDSVAWRLYAAVSDPETARELSAVCGEHGVMATAQGDTSGTHGRMAGGSSSSGRSENRSEIKRALIKPDELLHDVRADEAFVIRRGARPLRCGRASGSGDRRCRRWSKHRGSSADADEGRGRPAPRAAAPKTHSAVIAIDFATPSVWWRSTPP